MKRLLLILVLVLVPSAAVSEPPPLGLTVPAEVSRVIDGDTVEVRVSYLVKVRLLDCWAPETRTSNPREKRAGLVAKGRVEELLDTVGTRVTVHLVGDDGGSLEKSLTLGRVLGRVWLEDGRELSSVLVQEGYARKEKDSK